MQRRQAAIMIVIFLGLLVGATACSTNDKEQTEEATFDPKPDLDATQVSSYDEKRLNKQDKQEKALQQEYEEKDYTFSDPFIKVDPYDRSPLTALVQFETKTPVKVEVLTGTGDDEVTLAHEEDDYTTEHQLSVLGLYPDKENTAVLKATDEDGNEETTEWTMETEALPEDIPKTVLKESKPEQMEDGLTFMVPGNNYIYGLDENADVRWYADMDTRLIFNRLENGHILLNAKSENADKYDELLEMDMTGKITNAYNIEIDNYDDDNLLHHDVIELPNGNLLATTHDPDSKYVEDHMHEIDRDTGKTVQEIDLKDLFPDEAYEDYDGEYDEDHDWIHQNAIWFDDTDQSIVISTRHQDAVMKLSYPEAEVKWILAADEEWTDENEDKVLQPENGEVKFPTGQHAVKVLPDMDEDQDTADILLFDNNHVVTRGDKDEGNQYSRAVQYRIDEKDKTVKEVWSYGEERGTDFYSEIIGNAQYLPDTGNRLITSGYTEQDDDTDERVSKIVETNDKNPADVVFEITVPDNVEFSGKQIYRAIRMPLYP